MSPKQPGAGRVIAGVARGRTLVGPPGGTRPYTDRVKQSLFALIEDELPGAAVLDLFAGSGAGGIEALSRGAVRATFVEQGGAAIRAIESNLAATGFADGRARVIRGDVLTFLLDRDGAADPFDLVLLDPPFAAGELLVAVLGRLGGPPSPNPIVRPGGLVVARTFWRDPAPDRAGLLASERRRRVGDNELTLYRRSGD